MASLWSGLRLLREPIPSEKKRLLAERWETLPESVRHPFQGYGRQATGAAGATIGTFPKCDFDCQGCYLGKKPTRCPAFPRVKSNGSWRSCVVTWDRRATSRSPMARSRCCPKRS